jgi:hypothetical protein
MKNRKLEIIGTLLTAILMITITTIMFMYATSYEQVIYAVIIAIVSIIAIPCTYIMFVVLKKAFKEISK